jgi:hypothetical protein
VKRRILVPRQPGEWNGGVVTDQVAAGVREGALDKGKAERQERLDTTSMREAQLSASDKILIIQCSEMTINSRKG